MCVGVGLEGGGGVVVSEWVLGLCGYLVREGFASKDDEFKV